MRITFCRSSCAGARSKPIKLSIQNEITEARFDHVLRNTALARNSGPLGTGCLYFVNYTVCFVYAHCICKGNKVMTPNACSQEYALNRLKS